MTQNKQVIVIDETLPAGIMANSVAALSVSAGKLHPEIVGYPLEDNQGHKRQAITQVAIPVLKGASSLNSIREALKAHETEVTVIDITSDTSSTRTYDEYAERIKSTPVHELRYYALLIYGNKKVVNKYTGSLGLLR